MPASAWQSPSRHPWPAVVFADVVTAKLSATADPGGVLTPAIPHRLRRVRTVEQAEYVIALRVNEVTAMLGDDAAYCVEAIRDLPQKTAACWSKRLADQRSGNPASSKPSATWYARSGVLWKTGSDRERSIVKLGCAAMSF